MPTYSQEVHLDVHVTADGEALPQYLNDDASYDSDVITRYIEATAGAEFEVAYTISGPNPDKIDIRVACYIDGVLLRRPTHRHQHGQWICNAKLMV